MTALATPIGDRAARGIVVLAGRTVVLQLIQVVSSIVTARHLDPTSYGTFAIASTLLAFARYVGDLGVSSSSIVAPDLDARRLRTGAFISWSAAIAAAAAIFFLSPRLAAIVGGDPTAGVDDVTRVLCLALLCDALRFGPLVRLTRDLRFGRIGAISIAESVALLLTQIVALLLGLGIWALVLAQVIRSLVGTAVAAAIGGGIVIGGPHRSAGALVRTGIPFQLPAMLTGLTGFALPIVIVTQLGAHGVGLWAWATILAAPLQALLLVLQNVTLPSLARLREQRSHARADDATELLARVTVLFAAAGAGMLIGLAEKVVLVVFGSQWVAATGAVRASLLGLVPASLAIVLAAGIESRLRPLPRALSTLVASLAAIGLAIPLAQAFGVTGAAMATAVALPVIDAAILARIARLALGRALANGLVALTMTAAASLAFAQVGSGLPSLLLAATLALAVAVAVVAFVDRPATRELARPLRPMLARPPRVTA